MVLAVKGVVEYIFKMYKRKYICSRLSSQWPNMLLTTKIKCLQEILNFHWDTDTVSFPGSLWNIHIWISVQHHLTILEQHIFKFISEFVKSLEWEEKGKAACFLWEKLSFESYWKFWNAKRQASWDTLMGKEQEKRSKLYMQISFHSLVISKDSDGFKNKLIPGMQYTFAASSNVSLSL